MNPVPIIFLDFDGVIRIATDDTGRTSEFCQGRMAMLASICSDTGAKIVVSSDWRNAGNLAEIRDHLSPYLAGYLHADWATPICGHRWNEIARWMIGRRVRSYAILDDFAPHFDGCPPEMADRLVLCSGRFGLLAPLAQRVRQHLVAPSPP